MKFSRRNMLSTSAVVTAGAAMAGLPCATWAQASAGAAPAAGSGAAPIEESRAPTLPKPGAVLALRPVPLLDGSTFEPQMADGKVLVIYWWASWCPFCAVQSPHIEALWRKNRSRGLEVLALSIDRRREDALAYMQKKGYTFPAGMLTAEVATMLPKPKGLPVTVVRSRTGKVLFAEGGEMFPEDIEGLAKYL